MSRSDRELQAVLDALPLLFFHKDTRNRIVRANRAAAASLGVTPEDMAGTHTSRWYPDEAELYYQDDLEVIRSGRPKLGIVEPLAVEGDAKHWICTDKLPCRDADGSVTGLYVFIRDATAEAMTQAALRRNDAKLRSVLAAIPDAVFALDAAGRFTEIFTPDTDLLPAPAEQLLGRRVDEVAPGPLARRFGAAIAAAIRTRALQEVEYSLGEAEHSRWLSARVVYLETDGRPGVLWTARDDTRRKQAEESRLLLETRIREAQKLESLGLLAGGIAHDFNNLLVGILGNASLAREDLPADAPTREMLADIEQAALRAAELCGQMLAFSGRGSFVAEQVDLNAAVGEIHRLLGASTSRRIPLVYDLASNLPAIEGDPTQIRQVCLNLVTNAAEALEGEHGTLTLATGVLECDGASLAQSRLDEPRPAGRYVYLEVSDTGCGMDEETQQRMFEPFFTTRFTGRGLGLAAVLGIVRAHRGAILVESKPGQGTRVRVLFPCGSERGTRALRAGAAGGRGTVLVTDDDETVQGVARRILERAGFSVLVARSGAQCLDVVRRRPAEIACVILDLTMPEMSGEECYRALRDLAPELPVILSSGYSGTDVSGRLAGEGLAGFVQKPYVAAALVRAVSDALGSRETGPGSSAAGAAG